MTPRAHAAHRSSSPPPSTWSPCWGSATSSCAPSSARSPPSTPRPGQPDHRHGRPGRGALVERLVRRAGRVAAHRPGDDPRGGRARDRRCCAPSTEARPADVLTANILSNRGRTIRPKTLNQKRYVDAIDQHTIVFGIGPAGTGKTYLAVAKAVQALQAKQVNRIILTRPAVEAGERLGFLPGTLSEKIDPYLRPLYDALHDMIDPDSIPRLHHQRARSRSRRWPTCAVARSTTRSSSSTRRRTPRPEQMKMFLTRLGFGSTMVVTGRRHPGRPARRAPPAGSRSSRRSSTASTTSSFCRLNSPRRGAPPAGRRHRATPTAATTTLAGRAHGRHRRGPVGAADGPTSRSIEPRAGPPSRPTTLVGAGRVRAASACGLHPRPSCPSSLVDVERRSTELHVQWMDEPGPTDVLSFPMDELRPGPGETRSQPGSARRHRDLPRRWRSAQADAAGHRLDGELRLLLTHGILHLLGYDHAEPEEHARDVRRCRTGCSPSGGSAGRRADDLTGDLVMLVWPPSWCCWPGCWWPPRPPSAGSRASRVEELAAGEAPAAPSGCASVIDDRARYVNVLLFLHTVLYGGRHRRWSPACAWRHGPGAAMAGLVVAAGGSWSLVIVRGPGGRPAHARSPARRPDRPALVAARAHARRRSSARWRRC